MKAGEPRELVILEEAARMLAEAKSVEELKSIRDKAELARAYIRKSRMGLELQNRAAELKLRAERKVGEFLSGMNLRGGDRRSKRHDAPLKLDDLGITRDDSKRWQTEASVSERDFRRYLKSANDFGEEVTQAGLLRLARGLKGPVKSAKRQKAGKAQSDPRSGAPSEPLALIDELENHRQLLAQILRPVCHGQVSELKRGEQRALGHLLSEIESSLKELKRIWLQEENVQSHRAISS